MKSLSLFSLAALLILGLSGCKKDQQTITIDIVTPLAGVQPNGMVSLNIIFSASDELHDVEVHVEEEATGTEVLHFDQHTHVGVYTYSDVLDLTSYPSGTEFHLEAKAGLDEDGTQFVTEELHFTLP